MKMTKSVGQWKLPQPTDIKEDNEWVPIPRISRTIPYGYELDPNDNFILLPIDIELDMLEKAKKYLKQYSYREVSNWLTTNTGREISHVGLNKWADYAKKAVAKAEEIERTRLGAKENNNTQEDAA